MSNNNFLCNKLAGANIKQLLFMEIEGLFYWIFNSIPGTLGFLLRNLVSMILLNKKRGFIWIQPRVTLVETNKLSVGKNVGINSGTYINAKGGIYLGDNVLIGSNVTISSGKHPIEGKLPAVFERPTIPLPITIEDDVWIGAGSVIMPGVTLKKGTVVGANSVVNRDTKEYAVVVGAPAKCIRYRDKQGDI